MTRKLERSLPAAKVDVRRVGMPTKKKESSLRRIAPELVVVAEGDGFSVKGLPAVHDPKQHVYFSPDTSAPTRDQAIDRAWAAYAESGATSRVFGSTGGEYRYGPDGWQVLSGDFPTPPIRTRVELTPELPPRTAVALSAPPKPVSETRSYSAPVLRGRVSADVAASFLAQICPHLELVEAGADRWEVRGLPSKRGRGVFESIHAGGSTPKQAIQAAFAACTSGDLLAHPDSGAESFRWTGGAWAGALGELSPPKPLRLSTITRAQLRLTTADRERYLTEAFPELEIVETRAGRWIARGMPERRDDERRTLSGLSVSAPTRSATIRAVWDLCATSGAVMVTGATDPAARRDVMWSGRGWVLVPLPKD